ncbi:MAG: hypothetical protein ABL994_24725, partial [Verrucomicrobiales bacterium]
VLAVRTAAIADETGGISAQIATGLDGLSRTLNGLVDRFAGIHNEGIQGKSTWARNCEDQKQSLHHYRDESLLELRTLGERSLRIQRLTNNMLESIRQNSTASEYLEGPRQALQGLQERLLPLLQQADASLEDGLPPMEYTRTCTMESEKTIHRNACGSASELAGCPRLTTAVPGHADAMGDSVLFDEVPAVTAIESPDLDPQAGFVLAQDSSRGAQPQPSKPAVLEKQLGDTIELF